jgi:hypothetical protein
MLRYVARDLTEITRTEYRRLLLQPDYRVVIARDERGVLLSLSWTGLWLAHEHRPRPFIVDAVEVAYKGVDAIGLDGRQRWYSWHESEGEALKQYRVVERKVFGKG